MKILAIGAHPDDIELACAGTLLKEQEKGTEVSVLVCTLGGGKKGDRFEELDKVSIELGVETIRSFDYQDGKVRHSVNLVRDLDDIFEKLSPEVLLSHSLNDFHQDHIAVARAVISANRKHNATLITYPSWDTKVPFQPNLYVDITDYMDEKLKILKIFESQKDEPYMKPAYIRARASGTNIAKYVEKFRVEFMKL